MRKLVEIFPDRFPPSDKTKNIVVGPDNVGVIKLCSDGGECAWKLSGTEKLVREKTDGFEMEKNIFFLIDKEKFNFSKIRNEVVGLTFFY